MERVKILEKDGWILFTENKKYVAVTPEGYESPLYCPDANLIEKYFNDAVERGWVWVNYDYYVPSVYMSNIVVTKNKAPRRSNIPVPKDRFLTKESALKAIEEVFPEAEYKFLKCLDALVKLQKDMDFESGSFYEGDTHGTYNDHDFISFYMKGFHFSFDQDI